MTTEELEHAWQHIHGTICYGDRSDGSLDAWKLVTRLNDELEFFRTAHAELLTKYHTLEGLHANQAITIHPHPLLPPIPPLPNVLEPSVFLPPSTSYRTH